MKRSFFIFFLFSTTISLQLSAQTYSDSVFVTDRVKPHLYTNFPEGMIMRDSKGNQVDFVQHIKAERPFKDRPSLLIVWRGNFCTECRAMIDGFIAAKIQERFNVIMVNYDNIVDEDANGKLTAKSYQEVHPYASKLISLYDRRQIFEMIENEVTPVVYWLDQNLDIVASRWGYEKKTNQTENILKMVQAGTLSASNVKYVDDDELPAPAAEARYKLTVKERNGLYTYTQYDLLKKATNYQLNFIKSAGGLFMYDTSSLHIPKAEDLYDRDEITAGVTKMLNSIKTGEIQNYKTTLQPNGGYGSSLSMKGFITEIYDTKDSIMFSSRTIHPLLDRSVFADKHEEYRFFKKTLTSLFLMDPTETWQIFSSGGVYTINNAVKVIISDNEIKVVTKKDARGKILAGTNAVPPKKTHLELINLKGKVKSVTETSFSSEEKFGEMVKGDASMKFYEAYNKSGFRTELEMDRFREFGETEKYKTTTRYNDKNEAIEEKENDDGDMVTTRVVFDNLGNPVEMNSFDGKGNLIEKQKNKFNDQNLLEETFFYEADGKLSSRETYKYNIRNQLSQTREYDKDKANTKYIGLQYDESGNIIERFEADRKSDGKYIRTVYKYKFNARNLKTSETKTDDKGVQVSEKFFEYDSHGNLLSVKGSDKSVETYTYTYDQHNNWIKQVKVSKSGGTEISSIIEKQIKYY